MQLYTTSKYCDVLYKIVEADKRMDLLSQCCHTCVSGKSFVKMHQPKGPSEEVIL